MQKPLAEFIGTFTLVFFGCGAAVIAGMGKGATAIDVLGIAFAFGLAIVAMAYGIGPISGCHVNPAVSFGVFVAGRMSFGELITYAIAQVLGRYFESRSLRYHIEELPGDVLHIGFRASGHPVAVTVSFDDTAYDTYTHWDASQKQLALGRLADGFSRMMSKRSPAALAGDYHVERF